MFKKLFFAVLVLMLVLGLAGCSDDDTPAASSADSSSSGSVSSGAVSSSASVSSGTVSSSSSLASSSSSSVSTGTELPTGTTYTETFDNITGGMYVPGQASANSKGIVWSWENGRIDETLNGSAYCGGKSTYSITATLPDGVGALGFKFKSAYDDTPVVVKMNGTVVGTSPVSSDSVQIFSVEVNLQGSTVVALETGGRVIIDDITWTDGTPQESVPPTVSIASPSDGAGVTAYMVSLTGTASDADSGVASVQVKVDSGAWVDATGTTSWSYTTPSLTEGSHIITVRSRDVAGNYSSEQSITVTITHPADNDNPTVNISSPANGDTVEDLTPTISGTAADPGATPSGVASVQVRVDGGSWQTATGTTSWSFTPSSDLTEAYHTFEVKAVDNKGNESTVSSVIIEVCAPLGLTKDGSLPQAVQDYYNNAYGKTGDELRTALKTIISANHSVPSYDGLWSAYSSSDLAPNGKIWDMYSSTSEDGSTAAYWFTPGSDQCGNYSGENSCYNREHSWPKSWFSEASPMYSDLVHVVPTDGYVNGKRSNDAFGETDSPSWTSQNGSKSGPARSGLGYSGNVFEPIDIYKGDFARIYFYMCTRYWGTSESGPMSSNFSLLAWAQTMMKQWHQADPVSQKERDRNNAIQAEQGNRNPFVDYPSAVDLIDFTR